MSLFRQSILVVTVLIVSLLAGNLVISVHNAREYLSQQMQVHAEDTATSLAFSLSRAALEEDSALINSMVDIIFDRGYYRLIEFRDLEGQSVVKRELPIEIEGVPQWFVEALVLSEPEGKADVVSGWYRLGELQVISHPGYAYRDLWRVFVGQLQVFLLIAVMSYLFVGIGLSVLFRPLKLLERQADAIGRREFPVQERLPGTPELRSIVLAMNRMVGKVKLMFQEQVELSENLHRQSWVDPVTELPNRRDFDARLDALIHSEFGGGSAALILLHLSELQSLNDVDGRERGDDLLKLVASILTRESAEIAGAVVARRSGADFSLLLPSLGEAEVTLFVDALCIELRARTKVFAGVSYSRAISLGDPLLAQADMALRQAQHKDDQAWVLLPMPEDKQGDDSAKPPIRTAQQWRDFLLRAMSEESIQFHYQPIFDCQKQARHFEVFCRIPDLDGSLLKAGVFWPMLERFDLAAQTDRKVIEHLNVESRRLGLSDANSQRLCVNLSLTSILDADFLQWLIPFLDEHSDFASRLLFELPESCLAAHREAVQNFAQQLVARGAGLSLDHFGLGARAFSYLQSLPLACLKVDRSFIHQLNERLDNQFFVRSLVQISRSCDVEIFAEGLENEAEWNCVIDLGINGGQGFFLGEPVEDILDE